MGQPAHPLVTGTWEPSQAACDKWAGRAHDKVASHAELAVFLGGSPDSFTGQLLDLFGKADIANMSKLAYVFPEQVSMWYIWRNLEPCPTFAQLQSLRDILRS